MSKIKNIYQTGNYILNDAFNRIVAQIHIKKQNENLTTFVVSGTQPGVGSTSVAINLAISMAMAGWKTLLIDADLHKADKHKRLSEGEDYGLTEYLDEKVELEDVVYKTNYNQLYFVPGGLVQNSGVRAVCSQRMQELMKKVEADYDYVIIDVPAMSAAVDASVIANIANGVIMVTSQRRGYNTKAIGSAKAELDRVGANVLGIIVNQVSPSEYRRCMKNYDYFKKHRYYKKKGV